ncbi:Arc family DNA-binding protein [Halomonas sp. WWR20]
MKEPDPQFNVRLSGELRALIKEAAKKNNRSQTAEVAARLEESFVREGAIKGAHTVRHRSLEDQNVRELVVTMELMLSQLDLMRKELNERMKVLGDGKDDQS